MKCEFCKSKINTEVFDYESPTLDFETKEPILVPGVKLYKCSNDECGHSWIPAAEEKKIDLKVAQRSRERLGSKEIALFRESLGFSTKSEAANFLNLNTKAFVKWENEHFEPNDAYDLLIRLVARSRDNFEFVKHLHATNFKFVPTDYELLAGKTTSSWMTVMPGSTVSSGIGSLSGCTASVPIGQMQGSTALGSTAVSTQGSIYGPSASSPGAMFDLAGTFTVAHHGQSLKTTSSFVGTGKLISKYPEAA